MNRPRIAFCAVAALLMSACEAGGEPSEPEPTDSAASPSPEQRAIPSQPGETASPALNEEKPAADECGADKLGRWLNVLPTETVKTEIRETVGHDRIRYIAPGDVVTMDLRPDRLNVETGVDGRIKLFRCG